MSVVYRPNCIAAFTAQSAGKDLPTTITAQVANPAAASLSEGALARAVHATTLTGGFVPMATLAKHTELLVTALGYVYRTAGSSDDMALIKQQATAAVFRASEKKGHTLVRCEAGTDGESSRLTNRSRCLFVCSALPLFVLCLQCDSSHSGCAERHARSGGGRPRHAARRRTRAQRSRRRSRSGRSALNARRSLTSSLYLSQPLFH
jgi:hypothetical protein